MSVRDWVSNFNIKNILSIKGGTYRYNYRSGGAPDSVDPRWFSTPASSQRRMKRNRFTKAGWKSPEERFDDRDIYVLQFKFKKPTRINNISFELLDYSQEWSVRYYDSYRNKMAPVQYRRENNSLETLRGMITTNTGNWDYFNFDINKIKTTVFEVRLRRSWYPNQSSQQPPTTYSVGLKNLSFKFVSDGTEGGEGDNIVPGPTGFNEIIYYQHHDAYNAMDTSEFGELYSDVDGGDIPIVPPTGLLDESTIVPNTNSYWMSAPQGAAESVVSLYCDLRTTAGAAQSFNALRMLPLHLGPKMSVYYSNDDVVTNFAVSSNKFGLLDKKQNNAFIPPRKSGEGFLIGLDYNHYIDNTKAGLTLDKSFTIGMEFKPENNADSADTRCLWNITDDSTKLSFVFDMSSGYANSTEMGGKFRLIQGANTILFTALDQITIEYGKTYGVIVSYNKDRATWNVNFSEITGSITDVQTEEIVDTALDQALTPTYPTAIYLGARDTLSQPSYMYIRRLFVKQDSYFQAVSDAFFGDIASFANGDLDVPTSRRSIFYNALAVGNFVESGLVALGPNGGYYANKEWIPIPKDFTLVNTDYQLDQTYNAKYLKLEFTGLIPRWYQSTTPLPVRGFPQRIRSWFDSLFETGQSPYNTNVIFDRFEESGGVGVAPSPTRGFTNIYSSLSSGDENEFIFNRTLSTYDAVNRLPDDVVSLSRELEKASIHMKFPTRGRHSYELSWVPAGKQAFFVGIKDLQVYRSTQTQVMDDINIYDYMDDEEQIESHTGGFDVDYNLWFSRTDLSPESYPYAEISQSIVSTPYESHSKFKTIQMGVLDSPWQTCMGDAIANLDTIEYLVGVNCKTPENPPDDLEHYPFDIVTSSFQGRRGGEVVAIDRDLDTVAEYGAKIKPLVQVDGTPTYPGNYSHTKSLPIIHAQTSAAVRMYLPETSNGTYELRLWETTDYTKDPELNPESWTLAARRTINIPARNWVEEEITYMPENTARNWYTEIVQIDPGVEEPFLLDMLGIWQRPVTWEVTNNPDDITPKWYPVLFPLGNPSGYFTFPTRWVSGEDKTYGNFGESYVEDSVTRYKPMRFAIRATAKTGGVFIGAYQVVPWYEGSPGTNRAPIDYNPPWGVSDDEDLRAVKHKPLFQGWYHYFPLHDSTVLQETPVGKYQF